MLDGSKSSKSRDVLMIAHLALPQRDVDVGSNFDDDDACVSVLDTLGFVMYGNRAPTLVRVCI